jgi:hypothetical protein
MGAGFVVGTSLLHMIGIGLGFLTMLPRGELMIRGLRRCHFTRRIDLSRWINAV